MPQRAPQHRRSLSILAILVCLCLAAPLVAQDTSTTPAGDWAGAIELPGDQQLAIQVTLTPEGDGWSGTIDIPAQGLAGFALSNVTVDGRAVHFEMAGVPGTPTFDGELAEDGETIAGAFTQGGAELAFSLARAVAEGDAAPSGVPGEGVVGHWLGTLDVGAAQLRLALEVSAEDEGVRAVLTSLDQGNTEIPVPTTTFGDGVLRFEIPAIGASFEGTLGEDGTAIDGTFAQAGQSFPLTFERQEAKAVLRRPQEPQPPFPYETRDVTFDNPAADITLAGTVVTPEGEGPFPAVVFVSGSGPQDRDESLMGHKPFWVIADHLARHGIASLRYDDRGAGESEGDHMGSTVEDFATDAQAAVAYLAAQPKIDRGRLGILGHSEGGLSGPRAALAGDEVDFLVLLAPPGVPLTELLKRQSADVLRQQGMSAVQVEQASAEQAAQLALVADPELSDDELAAKLRARTEELRETLSEAERAMFQLDDDASVEASIRQVTTPWFRSLMRQDPAVYLEKTKVPVLALFGGKDIQVAAEENAAGLRAALAAAGNETVTVKIFPDANHLFQTAGTGAVGEYGQIEETMAPEVLEVIVEWIGAR